MTSDSLDPVRRLTRTSAAAAEQLRASVLSLRCSRQTRVLSVRPAIEGGHRCGTGWRDNCAPSSTSTTLAARGAHRARRRRCGTTLHLVLIYRRRLRGDEPQRLQFGRPGAGLVPDPLARTVRFAGDREVRQIEQASPMLAYRCRTGLRDNCATSSTSKGDLLAEDDGRVVGVEVGAGGGVLDEGLEVEGRAGRLDRVRDGHPLP
jgi:hypothetical protein